MSIWSEVKNNHVDDSNYHGDGIGELIVYIDAWLTSDNNEEGSVIAKVKYESESNMNASIKVEFLDERARVNPYALEVIQDAKLRILKQLVYEYE